MNWNEFYQALNAGELKPVYLFSGPENYVKNEALEAVRQKLLPEGLEGLNENILEGVTAGQIIDAAETLPMMCDRRLVVVRDWTPLLSGKSRNETDEVERMAKWLENPPDSCVLIFFMRGEPDGKKKLTTLLRRLAEPVRFDFLNPAELNRWIARRLKPLKKRMSPATVAQLSLTAGNELSRLIGELDKLTAYVGEREEITTADIQAVVSPSLEYRVFTMVDRLLAGNLAEAQRLLNTALETGEEPIGILATFTRQFRIMTHMKFAMEAGGTAAAVGKLMKLSPGAVSNISRQTRAFTSERLLRVYRELVERDYAIKSGQIRPEEALNLTFLKIGLKK